MVSFRSLKKSLEKLARRHILHRVIEKPYWFFLCIFLILLGAMLDPFFYGALLVGSFAAIAVFFSAAFAMFRRRRLESLRTISSLLDETIIFHRHSPFSSLLFPRRLSRWERLKRSTKRLLKSTGFCVAIVVLGLSLLAFFAPQIWKLLADFLGYLLSDFSVLAAFLALLSAVITGSIMLAVIFLYLPIDVIEEINEKKMEFGILGTVLLTVSNVLFLIQGMQGVCDHYPRLVSVALVGMSLAVACTIMSWVMCGFLLTKGIERRNASHFSLAMVIAVYAAITILYVVLELLGRLLGLGA